jgi:hypothetical protein
MLKIVIVSPAGYEAVMERIQRLTGAPEDSPEEMDLRGLVKAADAWDRGQGGEAAGETPDVPIQDSSWEIDASSASSRSPL